jgi:hypothetical protein
MQAADQNEARDSRGEAAQVHALASSVEQRDAFGPVHPGRRRVLCQPARRSCDGQAELLTLDWDSKRDSSNVSVLAPEPINC